MGGRQRAAKRAAELRHAVLRRPAYLRAPPFPVDLCRPFVVPRFLSPTSRPFNSNGVRLSCACTRNVRGTSRRFRRVAGVGGVAAKMTAVSATRDHDNIGTKGVRMTHGRIYGWRGDVAIDLPLGFFFS